MLVRPLFTFLVVNWGGGDRQTRSPTFRTPPSTSRLYGGASDDVTDASAFDSAMERLGISEQVPDGFENWQELKSLGKDFTRRPEVFSNLLQSDFKLKALTAHRIRSIVMDVIQHDAAQAERVVKPTKESFVVAKIGTPFKDEILPATSQHESLPVTSSAFNETKTLFKQVVVNEKAKRRKRKGKSNDSYGLPKDYKTLYPQLAREMDDFLNFMLKPSTISQESPIRLTTAEVYVRHAKLFLGWYVTAYAHDIRDPSECSLFVCIPSKGKESANVLLEFVMWLRNTRSISVSYEANILRGLTKMLKFRFAQESKADPTYGEKSFEDIPIIRELRKLHRDANKRQSLAPRSSDEERKWLTWSEYLGVVRSVQMELTTQIADCTAAQVVSDSDDSTNGDDEQQPLKVSPQMRRVATWYQYYLILSFFASVPDRQRTIRELEIDRTFVKDDAQNVWTIRHGPDDYKTGKTYGERPPLLLAPSLVPAIDDFLERWRKCLRPKTNSLFVQPRTGNPLSQDSVYQIVARNCFKYTGKKTNPHLLRDMIVTHVRDSDASEKQLEALALFMGHSIQMQRTSYDRRTLKEKVAPAVELLHSVNTKIPSGSSESK